MGEREKADPAGLGEGERVNGDEGETRGGPIRRGHGAP